MMGRPPTPPTQRFWPKVDKRGPDECWEWKAALSSSGYGILKMDGRNKVAHRFSYELVHGPIPDGLLACHHCDNTRCVNPAHIFLGTPMDNTTDMVAKGRAPNGEAAGLAKLTDEQVRSIRLSRDLLRVDAARYGVTKQAIWHIKTGRTWKHIAP